MGGKHIVLKIEDYELHEWSECELRGYLCGGISGRVGGAGGGGAGGRPAEDGGGASCCLLRGQQVIHFLGTI